MENYPALTHLLNQNHNHPGHILTPPSPQDRRKASVMEKNTKIFKDHNPVSCSIVRYIKKHTKGEGS